MKILPLEVEGRKYFLGLSAMKARETPPRLDEILAAVDDLKKKRGVDVVALNPEIVVSPLHLLFAVEEALRSHLAGRNVSKTLPIEVLLCTSGTNQISQAVDTASPRQRPRQLAAAALSQDEKQMREALQELRGRFNLRDDDRLLELTEAKKKRILELHGITQDELKASYATSEEEALLKCVLSRTAMLYAR